MRDPFVFPHPQAQNFFPLSWLHVFRTSLKQQVFEIKIYQNFYASEVEAVQPTLEGARSGLASRAVARPTSSAPLRMLNSRLGGIGLPQVSVLKVKKKKTLKYV